MACGESKVETKVRCATVTTVVSTIAIIEPRTQTPAIFSSLASSWSELPCWPVSGTVVAPSNSPSADKARRLDAASNSRSSVGAGQRRRSDDELVPMTWRGKCQPANGGRAITVTRNP